MVKSFTAYKHTVRRYPGVIFVHRLVATAKAFLLGGWFRHRRAIPSRNRKKSQQKHPPRTKTPSNANKNPVSSPQTATPEGDSVAGGRFRRGRAIVFPVVSFGNKKGLMPG